MEQQSITEGKDMYNSQRSGNSHDPPQRHENNFGRKQNRERFARQINVNRRYQGNARHFQNGGRTADHRRGVQRCDWRHRERDLGGEQVLDPRAETFQPGGSRRANISDPNVTNRNSEN
jgi:hypothetical protein